MSINSNITQGLGISGGYEAPVGDTLTQGYGFESGDINISDADAAKIARYVWNETMETGFKAREFMRLFASALGGKASGLDSLKPIYKALSDDSKDRITATVDEYGNRTSITLDLT